MFVCENNLYMEYTPIETVTAVKHPAADRASAYGLEPIVVDGNDVDAVYDAAGAAFDRARAGGGPALIEALTYRHSGHSRADPGKYRPDDEVREWLAAIRSRPTAASWPARGVPATVLDAIDATRPARSNAGHRGGQGRTRAARGARGDQRVERRRPCLAQLTEAVGQSGGPL